MGAFDWLYGNSTQPQSITSTSSASTPDWYNQFIQGIAGKGAELAGQSQDNPVPQQQIAGFTPDQQAAFDAIRGNQGSWKPGMESALGMTGGAVDTATGAAGAANAAVAGPAQKFTDNVAGYMSPYTQQVVDEIARQGTKNFTENVMPGITGQMIGAGQFGSTRNADILGRAATEAQKDITGAQAQALESGYAQAGTLFNADANRQQAQQQLQANTALTGGQLGAGTQLGAGQQTGALTQAQAGLQFGDAQALQAAGQQQQQLQQAGLDTAYNNQVTSNNFGWDVLDKLNSIARGVQLPTSTTSTASGALTRTSGTSPLGALGSLYGQATA